MVATVTLADHLSHIGKRPSSSCHLVSTYRMHMVSALSDLTVAYCGMGAVPFLDNGGSSVGQLDWAGMAALHDIGGTETGGVKEGAHRIHVVCRSSSSQELQ